MALISYRNLTVSFGGPLLLDDVGITIDRKERICLLGRNGEGKSTLLRILALTRCRGARGALYINIRACHSGTA